MSGDPGQLIVWFDPEHRGVSACRTRLRLGPTCGGGRNMEHFYSGLPMSSFAYFRRVVDVSPG